MNVAIVESGIAAVIFALVFVAGGWAVALRKQRIDPHIITSFSAGMASAYVFVYAMPELSHLQGELGAIVYYVALIGFLTFYGFNELGVRFLKRDIDAHQRAYRLGVGGFALYVWLVAYLLVHEAESTKAETLYTAALAVHFLTVDNTLREEHGEPYHRRGRFLLAAMAIIGWLSGVFIHLGPHTVALITAFVAGAVIVNSTIEELPGERQGRFVPFLLGGLVYGGILLGLA